MDRSRRLHRLTAANPLRSLSRMLSVRWRTFRNWRRMRAKDLDVILFELEGGIAALPESRSWLRQRLFGASALSLWEIDSAFQRIAADPRPKTVLLFVRDPALSLADLQTLRGMIRRLKASGKRIIAYAQSYDLSAYLIASAADTILMQPGSELSTVGLVQQSYFLKDALDAVGIALDVVAITPFKGALDQFSRESMSPEGRAQLEWLLDSRFTMVVNDIASGRGLTPDAVRTMIDGAPYLDTEALAAGYVDGLLYEEDLPTYLESEHLVTWEDARRKLIKPVSDDPMRGETPIKGGKDQKRGTVAILPITGLMLPGESGGSPIDLPIPIPFLDSDRAGDVTVVQQVRALIKDEEVAAVVLFIDSGGGAAVAAEAMTSALNALAKTRPVVAYMNGAAASGGYMVATPARWIVAQPGTITGSIGVVTAKPITGGLEAKLLVKSVTLMRGANADLYSQSTPFTPDQRAKVRASIEHSYRQFIEQVAAARGMTPEAVDNVGGGRVWTGAQAIELGLVDELGDLRAAVQKARELAGLPSDARTVIFEGGDQDYFPPLLPKAADPAAGLSSAASISALLGNARAILSGKAMLLMPFVIRK